MTKFLGMSFRDKRICWCIVFVLSLVLAGCRTGAVKTRTPAIKKTSGVQGRIIDKTLLQNSGNILVIPFEAGANVEATADLDKMSLMIVKGLIEDFEDRNLSFEIVNSDDAEKADYVVKGHVTKFDKIKGLKRWIANKKLYLTIEGQFIDRKTGNAILHFSSSEILKKKTDKMAVAYKIGQDISAFIADSIR